jgi:hypothetical protein
MALLLFTTARAQAPAATEYQLKAAYLYNFAKFVEWPPESFNSPGAAVQICVLGQNPFGEDLEIAVRNKTVNGRAIRVQQVRKVRGIPTCHILFIASNEASQLEAILEQLRGVSVLTVSDIAGFATHGGMINLVLDNDRIRFEVNAKAACDARLKISSKLLSLAKSVIE